MLPLPIPLRPRIKLTRFPWLTLLITATCVAVFMSQVRNQKAIHLNATNYCTPKVTRVIEIGQMQYSKRSDKCPNILLGIYLTPHPENQLQQYLDALHEAGDDKEADTFKLYYDGYLSQAPRYLTSSLWHSRGSWNPVTMVTSTLSHSNWDHLIANLFFFLSFSLIVETVLGIGLYIFAYLAMALGIGAMDNFVHLGIESLPTLGLSGVIMGMMVLAAYFAPKARINYFYFVFVFAMPQWAIAALYITWNLGNYIYLGDWSHENYMAHLSGALVGMTLAFTILRSKRHVADDLHLDEHGNEIVDPNWIGILQQWTMVPLTKLVVVMTYLFLLWLFIQLMSNYTVQVLIVAPFAIASWYLYKSYKENNLPSRARFRGLQEKSDRANPAPNTSAIRFSTSNTLIGAPLNENRQRRIEASNRILNRPEIRIDDADRSTRFWKRVAARVAPPLVGLAFGVMLWVLVQLISAYFVQVMIVAPIAIASWYLFKFRKERATTDSARYKKAMEDITNRRFGKGIEAMTRLADGGYTRAQVELGKLHEQGKGVPKLYDKAGQWYRRAAESGNKEAQYRLGLLMIHGQAIYQRKEEPLEWFEKSAKQGLAEAAMSLAHYYAHGRELDTAKACAWYHRAGELYLQQRRFEDAEVTIKEIKSLDPAYEPLLELENNFARLTA